jgi:hypothetical protein
VEFLTIGGYDFVQILLDTATYLASTSTPPSVMTTSYGGAEENFSLSDTQSVLSL